MKPITLSIKKLIMVIGLVGSLSSIATYFVSTQSYKQVSNSEKSPNIASNAPVTINYGSFKKSKDWFNEYEKNRPNISKHQFDQILEGMSYLTVVNILGIEGVEQSSSTGGKSYAWGKAPFYYLYMGFSSEGELQWKANNGLF